MDLPRALLIYAGTLDARLDIEWLRETARAMPAARIALVGPIVDDAHVRRLREEPNIEIRAPLPRAELAELMRNADVGLVPHLRTPLTETMSPLKLYEYLAGGLPVVATDLEPMRGIDSRVLLVGEGGNFCGGGSGRARAGPRRGARAARVRASQLVAQPPRRAA